jgi:hypothetical protein
MFHFLNNKNKTNGLLSSSHFTTTLLLVIVAVFLFNINTDIFNASAAPGQINGEGGVGYIPKWIDPSVPPTGDIKANGQDALSLPYGGSASITWTSQDTTSCTVFRNGISWISGGPSGGPTSTGALTTTTTYTLQCTGTGGTAFVDSVIVTVLSPAQCEDGIDNDGDGNFDHVSLNPTNPDPGCDSPSDNSEASPPAGLDLTANGQAPIVRVTPGSTATIAWVTSDITAGSCTVTGTNGNSWTGDSGSQSSNPITGPTVFTLQCLDAEGVSVSTSVLVTLLPVFEEF